MQNLFDLSGKVALITGGSRGLGLEMALVFAAAGADIVVASRKLDNCEKAAERIRAMGRRAQAFSVHAGRWPDLESLVDATYAEFGRIDILVNNAGMSPAFASHEVTEELFDKIFSLNFKGPFRLSALVANRMRAAGGGSIINISSVASLLPVPHVVPYSGAKAALNAMTVQMAHEYGPTVRVNAIVAGPFLTDISKSWPEEERRIAPSALGRPGRPEEIVTSAMYLASPASSFVTGSLLRCDGGLK